MDRYDEDGTQRLMKMIGDRCYYESHCSGPWNETQQATEEFLHKVGKELSRGADPTRRNADGMSALDKLLTFKSQSAKQEHTVRMLLSLGLGMLPVPVERLPFRSGPSWKGPLCKEDYRTPPNMFTVGRRSCSTRMVSPLDMLLAAGHGAGILKKRLDVLLSHVEDIVPLFSIEGRRFDELEQPILYIPPLVAMAEGRDWTTCLMLMEILKKRCSGDELRDILNARVSIVDGGRVVSDVTAYQQFSDTCSFPYPGETALHMIVRRFEDGAISSKASEDKRRLISELVENGADPFVANSEGLTPYGLACANANECMEFVRDPYRFRGVTQGNVESEFCFPDIRNRTLLARLVDRMERVFTVQWHDNMSDVADSMKNILAVYKSVERKMSDYWKDENRLILSQALARLAVHGKNARYLDTIPRLVETLLGAGADPRHSLPGHGPAWYEALVSYGFQPGNVGKPSQISPNGVSMAFLLSPMEDGKNLLETMSDEEIERLEDLDIAGAPQVEAELERRNEDVSAEPAL